MLLLCMFHVGMVLGGEDTFAVEAPRINLQYLGQTYKFDLINAPNDTCNQSC